MRFIKRFEGFVPGEVALVTEDAGAVYIDHGFAVAVKEPESAARKGAPERAVMPKPRLR